MIRSMHVLFAAACGLLMLSGAVQADGASPSMLAAPCAGCHSTDGKSPGAIPVLYGKSAHFITQRMLAFKTDARQGTVMNRIAKGYSEAEIAALAQQFVALAQPQAAQVRSANPSVLVGACAGCHGTSGESPGAIPGLYGKSANFIVQRMLEFKAGSRQGTVMNRIAKGYSEAEIATLAQHLGNQ